MRPYLAIIKDSFRAAFASRVLYVLLGLITLLLVAIAPFHYREVLDWKIKRDQHVRNPALLVERIVERKDDAQHPGVKRIWELLSDPLKEDLISVAAKADSTEESPEVEAPDTGVKIEVDDDNSRRGQRAEGNPFEDFPVYEALIDELNEIIQEPEFYREQDWQESALSQEATDLIESGLENLSEERSRRLNRLLVSNSVGTAIENGIPTALDFYYLVWKIKIFSSNTTHQQFANTFSSTIPWFFDKFVMSIGLFIAILVTANIIPETLDPGSLNLLLSKPVSRWALLVAKFVGGCAFVALCAGYLFLGTWVWLGFGMGIWDRGILFAIPVYILVFAIYYSVSTLVGIWYRSAILSVILTALFWAVCFGVGFSYARLDTRMQNGEITNLVPISEGVLQVDPLKKVYDWDDSDSKWVPKLEANMAQEQEVSIGIVLFMAPLGPVPDGLGPIFDVTSQKLISGIINLADPRSINQQECFISETDPIDFKLQGKFPKNSVALFASTTGPLAVTSSGDLFKMKPEGLVLPEDSKDEEEPAESDSENEPIKKEGAAVAETTKPKASKPDLFEKIGSTKTSVSNSKYVDLNRMNQELAVYRRGEVVLFEQRDDEFVRKAKLKIDTGVASTVMSCFISYQGSIISLALGNGQIITVDANTLEEKNGYLPETRSAVRQLEASPDGRWVAVVYRNETLWLLDNENPDQIRKANFRGQGTISCVKFDDQNRIWIADRTDRATLYDLSSKQELETYTPVNNWFTFAYRYAIGPVYKVFPKPGELYKVVAYLSSTGDTKYNRDVDLALTTEPKDPFGPLWSGLGFMTMVLALACMIFHFKDF